MKKLITLLLLASFAACNSKEKKNDTNGEQETTVDSVVQEVNPPLYDPESELYVWKSSFDYTKSKNPSFKPEILNADSLIKGLNLLNENILLEKIKISGDTIYTEVKDSKHLTEELGTSGAEMYLADVVLNLTEVTGIKYVNISMQEGSHMQPGTWSKENFAKYKPVN